MSSFHNRFRFASITLLWMGMIMFTGCILLIDCGPGFGTIERDGWIISSGAKPEMPGRTRKDMYIISFALLGAGGLCITGLSLAGKRVSDKSTVLPALITASIVLAVVCGIFWCFHTWQAYDPGVEWPPDNPRIPHCGTYFVEKEFQIIKESTLAAILWRRLILWDLIILAVSVVLSGFLRRREPNSACCNRATDGKPRV